MATSVTTRPQDRVLQAYIKKFGALPNEPNQLVSFSRADASLPTIIYSDAKKALLKIAKSIKGGSGTKKKSFKKLIGAGPKWQVGDEVLISKDRSGMLHYIGKVPEMGNDEVWYGIELTCGTMGQNDGSVKGKRYFSCQGKRGMFIPEKKLRRRLNRKDKERRNSYAEISQQVKKLQKEYAGDDASAAILYPSSQQPTKEQMTTLVFENPQHTERYGNGGEQYQSATLSREYKDSTATESEEEATPPVKKKKKKKKAKKKMTRQRSGSGHSAASRERRSSQHSKHDTPDDTEESDLSDVSELEDDKDSNPTVKTFDTLLKYILRQKGQYRQGLLDVYAHPNTHALIVEAFSEMKELKPAEQTYLWPALLKRWSKYTHKI